MQMSTQVPPTGTPSDGNVRVLESPSSVIKVLPFAVSLPLHTLQGWDEPSLDQDNGNGNGNTSASSQIDVGGVGVVGTITFLNNSAIVWFGWGRILQGNGDLVVGKGVPAMGPLVVSMPRTNYRGAFSGSSEGGASASQLIGGDNEDQMVGWQMASRLTQRAGYPVFVSCSLSSDISGMEGLAAGLDRNSVSQRAAALTERKVRSLLLEKAD